MNASSQGTPEPEGLVETKSDAVIICIDEKEATARFRRRSKTNPGQGQDLPPAEGNPPQAEDSPKPTDR
jgi:hypothetical protein